MAPQDDPLPIETGELGDAESLSERLGPIDMRQVAIWRAMTPARRAEIACQLYHEYLVAVRVEERQKHPEFSEQELNWCVTRRIQGDPNLGRR
jgi:hypothetical protein